jgi:hypothetical protein
VSGREESGESGPSENQGEMRGERAPDGPPLALEMGADGQLGGSI